jgi:DNA repair protein RadC
MTIRDWSAEHRPREKLLSQGPACLSDEELLAIFLRTGFKGTSAIDLAGNLIRQFDGLRGLLEADQTACCAIKGLGPAKVAQLQAIMELARRYLGATLRRSQPINSPAGAREYLQATMRHLDHEVFKVIFLDTQHRVIASESLFSGTLNRAHVYPREVLKRALHHNAAAVIFAHNHPSGLAEPSKADQDITRELRTALQTIDVSVLDHFVVGDGITVSMAERGLI